MPPERQTEFQQLYAEQQSLKISRLPMNWTAWEEGTKTALPNFANQIAGFDAQTASN
jgi:hypothetical protein